MVVYETDVMLPNNGPKTFLKSSQYTSLFLPVSAVCL